MVSGLIIQLILKWKDLFIQPALQREVLRIAAQQGHGRMAVYIVEAGQQQTVTPIVPLTIIRVRRGRPDIIYHTIPCSYILPPFQNEAFIQYINVTEQHCFLLYLGYVWRGLFSFGWRFPQTTFLGTA